MSAIPDKLPVASSDALEALYSCGSLISGEARMKLIGRRTGRGLAFAVVGALLAMPACAEGPGWTANSTVKRLVVTVDGGVDVELSPALTGCVSNSNYGAAFASVYPTHPGINRMKADLLLAYATGGVVSLYFVDNTCRVGEMILGGW